MTEEKFATPEGIEGTRTVSEGATVVQDQKGPVDQLTPADISAKTGLSIKYVEDLIRTKYLNPLHYTGTKEPVGSPEKAAEAARAREEGRAIFLETRRVSAAEMFDRFWSLPRGKKRLLDPRTHREVVNLSKGYPVDHRSDVMVVQGGVDPYGGRISQDEVLKLRGKIMVSPQELEDIVSKAIQAKLDAGWVSPDEAAILREQAAKDNNKKKKKRA